MLILSVLAVAAFLTAVVSAVIGMGGGILLLAVMLSFLTHAETIPAHGAVQLTSNGTRILAYLRYVEWSYLARFVCGALPGAAVGAVALWFLRGDRMAAAEPYLEIAIGIYVLVVTFAPSRKAAAEDVPQRGMTAFVVFGFLAGLVGMTVGAIGPLIAPLFLRCGFVKERLIATKATCQASVHLLKIPAFVTVGLVDYKALGTLILVMSVMVIPGTLVGRRLLTHVSEALFRKLYTVALLSAGLKVLFYDGLYKLVSV